MSVISRKPWQSLQSKIKSRLFYIYENDKFSDVKFEVGEKNVKIISAHKLILASSSKVFENMFYENQKVEDRNQNSEIVRLDYIKPEAFVALLDYVYTDEVNLTNVSVAIETAYAAKKFELRDLFKICLAHLCQQVSVSNSCQIYEGSVTLLGDSDLSVKTITFISNNGPEILASEGFLKSSLQTAIKIVRDVAPQVDNKILFLALIAWAEHFCDIENRDKTKQSIRETMEPFLSHIIFLSMSSGDFIQTVGESGILKDDEVCSIAINIEKPGSRTLPLWCAQLKTGDELRCVLPLTLWSVSSSTVSLSCRFTIGGAESNITGFETYLVLSEEDQDQQRFSEDLITRLNAKLYFENVTREIIKEYRVNTEMPCTIMRYYFPTPENLKIGDEYKIKLELTDAGRFYKYHCGNYERKAMKVPFLKTTLLPIDDEESVHGLFHALVFVYDSTPSVAKKTNSSTNFLLANK